MFVVLKKKLFSKMHCISGFNPLCTTRWQDLCDKKQLIFGFIPPPAVQTSIALSILFIYLCGCVRQKTINVNVNNIFKQPRLFFQAKKIVNSVLPLLLCTFQRALACHFFSVESYSVRLVANEEFFRFSMVSLRVCYIQ